MEFFIFPGISSVTTSYPIKYQSIYFQIHVDDLERAKKFYEDVFGVNVTWYMSPEVGWCELQLPSGDTRLGLNSGSLDQKGGLLTIGVEALLETRDYLTGKGVKVGEVTDVPDMVSYFSAWDSEGNRLQIVSDPRVSSQ